MSVTDDLAPAERGGTLAAGDVRIDWAAVSVASDDTAAPADTAVPRIAVIIVTYNSATVLDACLRSLPSDLVDIKRVVVADNGSRDDSVAIAKAANYLPMVTVELGRNAGYAAAINAGIEAISLAGIDAVMVLNPDCVVRSDTISVLWKALGVGRRGIAVPRLINPDGSLQPSLRRMPTVRRALAEAVLGARAGRIGTLGELISDPAAYSRPGPAVWATGAAMMISAEAVAAIGPWDESFLLYSEETEFALRAADQGWTLWYEPSAVVEHTGGESATSPRLAALVVVNKVALYRRRHNMFAAGAFYLVLLFGVSVRALMGRRVARAAVVALLRPFSRTRELAD
jgi:N-acetylglucosaminyl-diphospho-decaprenol L-rhamnosyltransferase